MVTTLIRWYGKTAVYGFFLTLFLLIGAGVYFTLSGEEQPAPNARDTAVRTARISSLQGGRRIELIGSVEAVDQQVVTAEASGRVVRVPVGLGDRVRPGTIIAELENASERAAVLQAEGSYEAALAGAAQGEVGVDEAQNALTAAKDTAVSVFTNAFNTFRSVLLNDVDVVYTDPTGSLPGLRISGGSDTTYLNNERVRFQNVLLEWRLRSDRITTDADLVSELAYAANRLSELAVVIDTLLPHLNDDDSVGILSEAELKAISTTLSADRATINSIRARIDSARTGLENAREALRRAQLGGTQNELSTANAQVKQALGSLRAAQAQLEKTILRSAISGTVNSISVKTGDFVSLNEVIARIANNDALEITTFVSEAERGEITHGQQVIIAGSYEGTITNIAPAVDPDTRKIEVKIAAATDELENGDTVRVAASTDTASPSENALITIPITALKVETDRNVVFTVRDDGILEAHEVTVGPLLGSNITIESGITREKEIVIDARGFNEGDKVSVEN